MNHAIRGKSGEPMAQLGVHGDQTKRKRLRILTGGPVKYVKRYDLTIVDITCCDIRAFYHSMNWSIEFIDEKSKVPH